MFYKKFLIFYFLTIFSFSTYAQNNKNNQNYPNKPISLIVPYPPGGSTDVLARFFASELSKQINQKIIVENRSGANTSVGASYVARSKSDGYTLLLAADPTFVNNHLIYSDLGYENKSFEFIALTSGSSYIILTNPKTKLNSINDVIKSNKSLSFGSFGIGSNPHLAGEYLSQLTKANLIHVPYQGSSPAIADLIGNQIPLSIDSLVASLPQIKAGKLKALAITTSQRSILLPEIPTVTEELSLNNYNFDFWFAVVAPKGTPKNIIDFLAKQLKIILNNEKNQQTLVNLGYLPIFADSKTLISKIDDELKLKSKIIKEAEITLN